MSEDMRTLRDEAERLVSYWERHGNDASTVAKWAVDDLLGLARFIMEAES